MLAAAAAKTSASFGDFFGGEEVDAASGCPGPAAENASEAGRLLIWVEEVPKSARAGQRRGATSLGESRRVVIGGRGGGWKARATNRAMGFSSADAHTCNIAPASSKHDLISYSQASYSY